MLNELRKKDDTVLRILCKEENDVLIVDCLKKTMLHDRIEAEKKIGSQTSSIKQIPAPLLSVKKNIDLTSAKSISEVVTLCKENSLDAVEELSKVFTVEAVAI